MKKKAILIDGNNLLHRAYHKYKSMRSPDGKPSGVVFGVPYIISSLIKNHKPDKLVVIFDGGKDKNRLKVLPDYKKRQPKADFDYEDFISQKEAVIKMLKYLGVSITYRKDLEADDIMYLQSRRLSRKYYVMIVSTDKDFAQLIDKYVSLWNPWKNERITHLNCTKHYPFNPENCVDFLILDGDTSDNIPGYRGVGEKTAVNFLLTYGSIENYLYDLSLPEHTVIKRDVLVEIYNRNKLLIDIRYFCKTTGLKYRDIPFDIPKKQKRKELALLCATYGINIFTKPDFINTFKKITCK